jgi:hypothetical protein
LNAGNDIYFSGSLFVTGKTSMIAGDDIQINGSFKSDNCTAVAGDYIRLRGYYNIFKAYLKANSVFRL